MPLSRRDDWRARIPETWSLHRAPCLYPYFTLSGAQAVRSLFSQRLRGASSYLFHALPVLYLYPPHLNIGSPRLPVLLNTRRCRRHSLVSSRPYDPFDAHGPHELKYERPEDVFRPIRVPGTLTRAYHISQRRRVSIPHDLAIYKSSARKSHRGATTTLGTQSPRWCQLGSRPGEMGRTSQGGCARASPANYGCS